MFAAVEAFFGSRPSIERKEARESFSVSYQIDYKELNFGKKLGEGGFGVVHQGTWRKHTNVAIKQLLVDDLSHAASKEFDTETQTMVRLRSPHIVQFYGYCVSPKRCIVMEYMPNGSLYKVLKNTNQPLDWSIRIRIAIDMASGLAFLHEERILHRDIKSLNVLLDESYRAKLADFGLAKVKTEVKPKSRQDIGTPAWMAPELFKGTAYTEKSDIYSFGITLWELAARKIPFVGVGRVLIPSLVNQGTREAIPEDCPQKLASLIAACWAGSPNDRPDADAVATYLKSDQTNFAQFLPLFVASRATRADQNNVVRVNPLEQKKPLAPKVNASDLQVFLRFVAEGEQDKAEAMLKINPNLGLVPGDVTDLSKRTFIGITGFQYAVWALDWHMWKMLSKKEYLSAQEAKQQAEGFETGAWVRQHGIHAQHLLDNLIKALQVTIRLHYDNTVTSSQKRNTAWVQQVGVAQLSLPVHVINEYCHPYRAFRDIPDFRCTALPFERSRIVDTIDRLDDSGCSDWFTVQCKGGTLGNSCAIQRGQCTSGERYPIAIAEPHDGYETNLDLQCIRALCDTRVAQREELVAKLRPKNIQRKVA